jgi:hypothetical protein
MDVRVLDTEFLMVWPMTTPRSAAADGTVRVSSQRVLAGVGWTGRQLVMAAGGQLETDGQVVQLDVDSVDGSTTAAELTRPSPGCAGSQPVGNGSAESVGEVGRTAVIGVPLVGRPCPQSSAVRSGGPGIAAAPAANPLHGPVVGKKLLITRCVRQSLEWMTGARPRMSVPAGVIGSSLNGSSADFGPHQRRCRVQPLTCRL